MKNSYFKRLKELEYDIIGSIQKRDGKYPDFEQRFLQELFTYSLYSSVRLEAMRQIENELNLKNHE